MKIVYVACKYDYMDQSRGHSFEHYNFYETLLKLPDCQIIYFPYERMLQVGRDKMNEELKELVIKEKPDILFAAMFNEELKKEVIEDISKNTSCQTVAWFFDDYWRFDNYSKHWAPAFNWVATTDSLAPAKYYAMGYNNVIKTQYACNHFLYQPLDLPKIYDVTFVGQSHGNRKKIINQLEKMGIKVECFGRGWPNGRVSEKEMINIFSQSKINLNLTNVSMGVNVKSLMAILFKKTNGKISIQHPQYWLGNMKSIFAGSRGQIKGRNFEIPGCGGFLITGQADNLPDYYQDGKEIVIFKNIKDLVDKITYYLGHDKEREQIALAGYGRTMQEHTYEKRFKEIIALVQASKK